jgi:hypothetical protein
VNDTFDKQQFRQWVQTGMGQGAKWGSILAIGYMLLPLVFTVLALIWQVAVDVESVLTGGESRLFSDPAGAVGAIIAGLVFTGFYLGFGGGLGVLPATVIGMVSGGILGAVLSLSHIAPYRWNRLAVGVGVAFLMAVAINHVGMWMFSERPGTDMEPYLFFIGVPSMIFLGFSVWLSDNLPRLIAKRREVVMYGRSYPPLTEG